MSPEADAEEGDPPLTQTLCGKVVVRCGCAAVLPHRTTTTPPGELFMFPCDAEPRLRSVFLQISRFFGGF